MEKEEIKKILTNTVKNLRKKIGGNNIFLAVDDADGREGTIYLNGDSASIGKLLAKAMDIYPELIVTTSYAYGMKRAADDEVSS